MSAAIIAWGALSPLGRGRDAFASAARGEPARSAIRVDESMRAQGFARPVAARVAHALLSRDAPPTVARDRASHLLFDATSDLVAWLDRVRPAWRSERLGVVLGTSSGGMLSAEALFEARAAGAESHPSLVSEATYFAPFRAVLDAFRLDALVETQLVTACAASTWALGLALRALRRGTIDVCLAGGYDALGPFVASGFEALKATTKTDPAPFRVERDGMALGEGAAIVALVREGDERDAKAWGYVHGFGASTDAVHITAPDRTGGGLRRAAEAAFLDAGASPDDCPIVSAHGTSTPYNDAMEARAIREVFSNDPVVHPFKSQIGHTLGAAGVLETLAVIDALREGVLPASAGEGTLDEEARVKLLARSEPHVARGSVALKQSAAFGGANAALVVGASSRVTPSHAFGDEVFLGPHLAASSVDLEAIARVTGVGVDKLARMDDYSLIGATALAQLVEREQLTIDGGGVVVGHALATVDVNERFYRRVLSHGPRGAEPRLFPPTSPNLAGGQIAILFGLRGPSAACCGGLDGGLEALSVAVELCLAGDASHVVVIALDVLGETARTIHRTPPHDARTLEPGAVAVIVSREALPSLGPTRAVPAQDLSRNRFASGPAGHLGLKTFLENFPAIFR